MGYEFHHEGRAFTPEGSPPVESTPAEVDARNRATSAEEIRAFKARENDGRYFAYAKGTVSCARRHLGNILCHGDRIVTWMGDTLGTVFSAGYSYECPAFGHPSTRQRFSMRGIDGRVWHGTFYVSSGDYVRMRVAKSS